MVEKVSFGYIWQNIVSDDLRKLGKRAWHVLFCEVNIAPLLLFWARLDICSSKSPGIDAYFQILLS